ncbi:hypothetical protein LCL97_17395 [Seohaeicola saemankumensis]|nr:hypothetical protein [Seohaeicola saemankumensis]MCA0872612.1 hypothetical protein [Seohaeicola saemankumensis]
MSTWICKPALATAIAVALAGCDGATGLAPSAASKQMTEVDMAGGQVTLATPTGYCIDPRSVRKSPKAGFALVARCDTLDARGFSAARELALITVTTGPLAAGARSPSMEDLTRAVAPAKILERTTRNGLPMVRLETDNGSVGDVSPQHWRTAFALNGQMLGLALYAPETSGAMNTEGPAVLSDMVYRTRRASARPTVLATPETPSPTKPENKSPLDAIAGLFE